MPALIRSDPHVECRPECCGLLIGRSQVLSVWDGHLTAVTFNAVQLERITYRPFLLMPSSAPFHLARETRAPSCINSTPDAPPRLLYSRKQTAYLLSLSLRAIAYMIASGDLRTKHHGGRVMITHAELLRQAALDDRAPIVPKKTSRSTTMTPMRAAKAA
jgi:hypothetical protein